LVVIDRGTVFLHAIQQLPLAAHSVALDELERAPEDVLTLQEMHALSKRKLLWAAERAMFAVGCDYSCGCPGRVAFARYLELRRVDLTSSSPEAA
jgi:hypothetical protein